MSIEKVTNQINPKAIQTVATSSNWGKVESPDKFDVLIAQNFDKFAKGDIFVGGKFIPYKQSLLQRILTKIDKMRINK